MELDKTPGLKRRPRKDGGETLFWQATQDAIRVGWLIKQVNFTTETEEQIAERCQTLWAQMKAFIKTPPGERHRPGVDGFDGTLRAVIDAYQTHPKSRNYRELSSKSRYTYDFYARKLRSHYGNRLIACITPEDVEAWFADWCAPNKPGGEERLPAANMILNVLKASLRLGRTVKFPGCGDLYDELREFRPPKSPPRDEQPTLAEVKHCIAVAHGMGRPSAALAFAMQWDTMARPSDLVGQWLPLEDKRCSSITFEGQKWIGAEWGKWLGPLWGGRVDDGDPNLPFTYVPSKTRKKKGRPITIELKPMKLTMAEIDRIPPEARTGPLIINEQTGRPYRADTWSGVWRAVRKAAGLSFQNRDLRAGGVSHASACGASADDISKMTGHSSLQMIRTIYDRDSRASVDRVTAIRNKA